MTRIGTILPSASLAFVLAFGVASSASAQEKSELEKLADRVQKLEKTVGDNKDANSNSYESLLLEVSNLRYNLQKVAQKVGVVLAKDDAPRTSNKPAPLREDELLKRIDKLEAENRELKAKLAANGTEAKRIDTTGLPKARLRFINKYTYGLTVYVNGKPFDLPAQQELSFDIPPGNFTYHIPQLEASPRYKEVKENGLFEVEIK